MHKAITTKTDSTLPTKLPPVAAADGRRFDRLHVVLIVLLTILVTAIASIWVFTTYLFPTQFVPVTLNTQEQRVLDAKLQRMQPLGPQRGSSVTRNAARARGSAPALQPEAYSEAGAARDITFSEKELNALLAHNTDLARKLAIDLSDDLLSAKLLVPLDANLPLLGGKTLQVKAGLGLAFDQGRPVVVLKGVSVMGVPLPNAWLGSLKNIDLVQEFGRDGGFWAAFADGVEHMQVRQGRLSLRLKE